MKNFFLQRVKYYFVENIKTNQVLIETFPIYIVLRSNDSLKKGLYSETKKLD